MKARFARLIVVHMAGNAALLLALWYWLAVPDRSAGHIAFSVLLALAIVFGFVWLQGAALVAFRSETKKAPFRSTLRRAHEVALGLAVLLSGPALAIWLGGYAPRIAAWISALLTSVFRKPVSPGAVAWLYPALLWILAVAWFIAVLPSVGRRVHFVRSRRYWIGAVALAIAGILLPWALVSWVPAVKGLTAQAISLAVRFALAYAIAVAAWLGMAALAGETSSQIL